MVSQAGFAPLAEVWTLLR